MAASSGGSTAARNNAGDCPAKPSSWPLRAGFLQFRVRFGDPGANLAEVRQRLAALAPAPATLVLLPELWSGGFCYRDLARQAAETPALLAALVAEAGRYGIFLAGSLPEAGSANNIPSSVGNQRFSSGVSVQGGAQDGAISECIYNTLFLVGPEGVVDRYRKQQLFAPMAEPDHFRAGGQPASPLAAPWGPVAGLVCFDLRFPELAAAQVRQGATILLISAQWPLARREHWRTLLRARAIENQIFVVACNTCGRVGENDFAGSSTIIAPDGEILAEAGEDEIDLTAPLDFSRLVEARRRFMTAGGICR